METWLILRAIASRAIWCAAAVAAVAGGLNALASWYLASGAPQQGAAAAFGCLVAIAPYVVARAFDEITAPKLR